MPAAGGTPGGSAGGWDQNAAPTSPKSVSTGLKSLAASAPSAQNAPKVGLAPDLGRAPLANLAKPGLKLGSQQDPLVARNAGHAEALPVTTTNKNFAATQPLIIATMALSIAAAGLVRRWFARTSQ